MYDGFVCCHCGRIDDPSCKANKGNDARVVRIQKDGERERKRYYHMIIQRPAYVAFGTETRRLYISTRQGSAPAGWVCVAVCGYHEGSHRIRQKGNHCFRDRGLQRCGR